MGLAFTGRSLYGDAEFGDRIVSRTSNPAVVSKLAAVALIAAACALTGCGRKGGLDLPPGASSAQVAPTAASAQMVPTAPSNPDSQYSTAGAATAHGNVFDATPGTDPLRNAPKGQNKRILLDSLLD